MSHPPATYIWEFKDWQGQPVFLSSSDSGGYYPKYSFELIREIDGEFKATDIRQLDFDGEYPFFGSRGEIVQGADEQVVIAIHTADTTAEDTAIADTDTTNMAEDAAKEDAAAPPPSLALVSLRNLPGNQVKLRAAYTADGQSWRMTPEYDFSDNATLAYFLSAQIKLLPDEQPSADSGDPVSWLELYLGADTPRGPQLWLTRIRLQ